MVPFILALTVVQAKIKSAAEIYREAKDSIVVVTSGESVGSGFLVRDGGTFVVTCAHVLTGEEPVKVDITGDMAVEVLYRDDVSDVAVLGLSKALTKHIPLRKGPAPTPGSKVYVIGSPLGFLDKSISDGIVSALRKEDNLSRLQITAPISKGSSGSAVLDEQGAAVGMVVGLYSSGQALNFALSAWDISKALQKAREKVELRNLIVRLDKYLEKPKTLGKLGQTIRDTKIYSSASDESQVLYNPKRDTYLVVKESTDEKWVQILMQNGRHGFCRTRDVSVLPFEVTSQGSKLDPSVVGIALKLIGKPVRPSGSDPEKGFGYSEFVSYVFQQAKKPIPTDLAKQSKAGKLITRLEHLQPGDRLYFWNKKLNQIGHVGIYAGNGKMIHADAKSRKIALSPLTLSTLVTARR